jgi:hypothetical protein
MVSNIGPVSRSAISRSTIDSSVSVSRSRKLSTGRTSRIRSKDTGESAFREHDWRGEASTEAEPGRKLELTEEAHEPGLTGVTYLVTLQA